MYELSAFAPRSICLIGRSDQSTAFAGVRLFSAWSLRPPELCSCDLRSNAPTARLSRRSFSAFPVSARPPFRAFDLRRGRRRGDLPPRRLRLWQGRFGRLCLPPLLGWCSVSAPLRRVRKENCKRLVPFTIFFPTKHHLLNKLYYFCVTIRKEGKL